MIYEANTLSNKEGYLKFSLYSAIALIGITALISQVVLIRELITTFYGNELIYGIILSLWLLLTAFGSGILGRFADKLKDKILFFVLTQIIIIFILPIQIYVARTIKVMLGVPLGTIIPLSTIICSTLLILLPLSLILGFQFALGSRMLAEKLEKSALEVGRTYMWETLGAIIGGLLFSFALIYFMPPFTIAALLEILLCLSALFLLTITEKGISIVWRFFIVLILFVSLINLFWLSRKMEILSSVKAWAGYNLLKSTDSLYGRLAITKDKGEYNFFQNGGLLFTTADTILDEEYIHLAMLEHSRPKKILLVGGGLGGLLEEILKYKIDKVDYLELDPKLIKLAEKTLKDKFIDQRLNILAKDGRLFINSTKEKYDLILINLPDPGTALLNRYYTLEFLKACGKILRQNGVAVFKLSTSESYIGRELRILNASFLKTLDKAFPHTLVIPSNYNYFFASEDNVLIANPDILTERFNKRNIETKYFKPFVLNQTLSPLRIKYINESLKYDEKTKINHDLFPVSYLYNILIWASYFKTGLKSLFYSMINLSIYHLFIAMVLIFIILRVLAFKYKKIALPLVIGTLGFAAMSLQLIVLLTFQSVYGYAYHIVGLIITLFMAGLAGGSFTATANYHKIIEPLKFIKGTIIAFIIYIVFLLIFIANSFYAPLISKFVLPLAIFLISFPIGFVFPLAAKSYRETEAKIGRIAGTLYGMDLAGGAVAAVIASIFFIPVYGLIQSGLIVIFLCTLGLTLLIGHSS